MTQTRPTRVHPWDCFVGWEGMLAFEMMPSSVIIAPRDKAVDSVTPDGPDSSPLYETIKLFLNRSVDFYALLT